jgi:hypothetical protein
MNIFDNRNDTLSVGNIPTIANGDLAIDLKDIVIFFLCNTFNIPIRCLNLTFVLKSKAYQNEVLNNLSKCALSF